MFRPALAVISPPISIEPDRVTSWPAVTIRLPLVVNGSIELVISMLLESVKEILLPLSTTTELKSLLALLSEIFSGPALNVVVPPISSPRPSPDSWLIPLFPVCPVVRTVRFPCVVSLGS